MDGLPEYKYTENDMDTLRAVLKGCQRACQDLRNLLKAILPNYLEYRHWSPVDLSDEELIEQVKLALDSPAQKEWERQHGEEV